LGGVPKGVEDLGLEGGGRTEEKSGAVDERHSIVDEGKKFG